MVQKGPRPPPRYSGGEHIGPEDTFDGDYGRLPEHFNPHHPRPCNITVATTTQLL